MENTPNYNHTFPFKTVESKLPSLRYGVKGVDYKTKPEWCYCEEAIEVRRIHFTLHISLLLGFSLCRVSVTRVSFSLSKTVPEQQYDDIRVLYISFSYYKYRPTFALCAPNAVEGAMSSIFLIADLPQRHFVFNVLTNTEC